MEEKKVTEAKIKKPFFLAPEKFDVKFIFDHVRNYGIAGGVLLAGKTVAAHGPAFATFLPAGLVGGIIQLVGASLMTLNFAHGFGGLLMLKESGKRFLFVLLWSLLPFLPMS
ncbi:hypothetical protein AWV80_17525 [Cupriavidus sp. UYMU48A]|nr:hypothetical protein AWV80_17525 [Cupriavidus sp. UYMU48A]